MMKFFRKYNKHLLAVFMALLLVIWLGGTALEEMVKPDTSKQVLGKAISGNITEADRNRADYEYRLQQLVGLDWRQAFSGTQSAADETLDSIDWILLTREAENFGIKITAAQARAMLGAEGANDKTLRTLAARFKVNVTVDQIYQAVASFFEVREMVVTFRSALVVPETSIRSLARDVWERASVRLVSFPATVFADPDEAFGDAELKAQFDKYKDEIPQNTGMQFGYYQEPRVKIEYIKIDPEKIKGQLRTGKSALEKKAYALWSGDKENYRFRRSATELKEARERIADLTSNGDDSSPAEPSGFYETFDEARVKALDMVKSKDAQAEAERIANALALRLAEPWFAVDTPSSGFKPAPEPAKTDTYLQDAIATLPVNLRYEGDVDIGTIGPITERELAEVAGLGRSSIPTSAGNYLSVAQLAFNVETLATIPDDDRVDRNLYYSLWQPVNPWIRGSDGALYIIRMVAVEQGHSPADFNVVRSKLVEDLRLLRGLERAREAAETFAQSVADQELKEAFEADEALVEKISPDRGGYLEPPAFARQAMGIAGASTITVRGLGKVSREFVDKAFELAAKGEASGVAVVDVPSEARVVVLKGKELLPLYEEDFQMRRAMLERQLATQKNQQILSDWLNAKRIRERNNYRPQRG